MPRRDVAASVIRSRATMGPAPLRERRVALGSE